MPVLRSVYPSRYIAYEPRVYHRRKAEAAVTFALWFLTNALPWFTVATVLVAYVVWKLDL